MDHDFMKMNSVVNAHTVEEPVSCIAVNGKRRQSITSRVALKVMESRGHLTEW